MSLVTVLVKKTELDHIMDLIEMTASALRDAADHGNEPSLRLLETTRAVRAARRALDAAEQDLTEAWRVYRALG